MTNRKSGTRKPTGPKWVETDASAGLQIYIRTRLTLTFDLLTLKVERFIL